MAKVLVIRTSSFGDVAILVPILYSIAAKYPQDRFMVMTRKSFAPLFENLSFNISVLAFDPNNKHKGVGGMLNLLRRLSLAGFTHVADEHDVLRSKVIRYWMKLTGCKVAHIDKDRKEKEDMIVNKTIDKPLKSTTERYREVFDKLGFPADMVFNNFFDFIPRNFSDLKSIVKEKNNQWIGIAPFAKHREKVYPLEKMEKIVETLSKDKNITVFLLGAGKKEQEVFNNWVSKYPSVINTSGKLNLEKELLLISYMDTIVSMDSANMHLASLVQVPVVSIWGATHPSMGFYGFNQDLENAVQIDLECRPCSVYGNIPCYRKDYACMEQIPETMILDKIYKVLESRKE